ncbi:hypothetical protein [Gordonia jacobaea]|uniref:hypothetical protein n=1 Tax=Gordonia jacobaea TaxID=122202 RepID=UPI003D75CDEE
MPHLDAATTVMLIISITLGVAASGCALAAAYVYLHENPKRDNIARDRLARRWLIATAVLGFAVVLLRFIWLLVR